MPAVTSQLEKKVEKSQTHYIKWLHTVCGSNMSNVASSANKPKEEKQGWRNMKKVSVMSSFF